MSTKKNKQRNSDLSNRNGKRRSLIVAVMASPFYVDQFINNDEIQDWYFYGDDKRRASWGLNSSGLNTVSIWKLLWNIAAGYYDRVNLNSYASKLCFGLVILKRIFRLKVSLTLGIYEEIIENKKILIVGSIRRKCLQFFFDSIDEFYPCGNVALKSSIELIRLGQSVSIKPYAFSRNRVSGLKKTSCVRNESKVCILFSGACTLRRNPYELVKALMLCPQNIQRKIVLYISSPIDNNLEVFRKWLVGQNLDCQIEYDRAHQLWSDVLEIYIKADLVVVPNSYSSWNMTVQEALSFGVPVIGTIETAAVREFIRPGQNGYIYESGDLCKLAILISDLVNDKNSLNILKKECISKSHLYYAEEINNLYKQKLTSEL